MTNKEALIATLATPTIPENMVEKGLIDYAVDGESNYIADNRPKIDAIAIDILMKIKHIGSISEGGFSVTFNTEEVDKTIRYISSRTSTSSSGSGGAIGGFGGTIKAIDLW